MHCRNPVDQQAGFHRNGSLILEVESKNPQTGSTLQDVLKLGGFLTSNRIWQQGQQVHEASGQADAKRRWSFPSGSARERSRRAVEARRDDSRVDWQWTMGQQGPGSRQARAKTIGRRVHLGQWHRPQKPGNSFLATQCKRRRRARSARQPPHGQR